MSARVLSGVLYLSGGFAFGAFLVIVWAVL